MTETSERQHSHGWVWGVVIGGVVLSLILACVVGAAAGFLAGRAGAQGRNILGWFGVQPRVQQVLPRQVLPTPTPQPGQRPNVQRTPQAPNIQRMPRLMGGALIQEITPGSPAEQAGLQVGDIIIQVNDVRLSEQQTLADVIGQHKPGDEVTLTLGNRAQRNSTVKVKLGANPNDASKGYLGLKYAQLPDASQFQTPQGQVD
jgi:S1-C subfamily serine protease